MSERTLVVLTGASRGFGGALFVELRDRGYRVAPIVRDIDIITSDGKGQIYPIQQDLAAVDLSPALDALGQLLASLGNSLDAVVFINNAGTVEPLGVVGGLDPVALQASITLNLVAPAILSNLLVGWANLRTDVALTLVNVTSGAAKRPIEEWGAYCAAKAGCSMFFNVIEAEAGPTSSGTRRVIHFDPGALDTDMQTAIRAKCSRSSATANVLRELARSAKLTPVAEAASALLVVAGL